MDTEEIKKYVLKALENNFTKFPVEVDKNTKLEFKDGDSIWECGVRLTYKKKVYDFQFGDYTDSMAGLLYYDDVVTNIADSILYTITH